MFSVLRGYLNPGDEVICIEPFFDQYTASIVSSILCCRSALHLLFSSCVNR